MANETFKDASGTTKYRKSTGAGSSGDPAVTHVNVDACALPTGASSEATLAAVNSSMANLDTYLSDIQANVATGVPVLGTVTISGAVTQSGTWAVTQSGTWAVQQSGTWNITNISGTISLPTGAATAAKQPALGSAGSASSDVITIQGVASMVPVQTFMVANVTGGLTAYKLISGASTNATSVKAAAGKVCLIAATNNGAAARYLKLYNKASSPTVGSDTPVQTYMLPAGGGIVIQSPIGIAFSTGIALAITSGIADSNSGAVSADEVAVNIGYI